MFQSHVIHSYPLTYVIEVTALDLEKRKLRLEAKWRLEFRSLGCLSQVPPAVFLVSQLNNSAPKGNGLIEDCTKINSWS